MQRRAGPARPLLYRYITVTPSRSSPTVTLPLHYRYITVTLPLQVQPDPCDYKIICCSNALQCLACLFSILAIFVEQLRVPMFKKTNKKTQTKRQAEEEEDA